MEGGLQSAVLLCVGWKPSEARVDLPKAHTQDAIFTSAACYFFDVYSRLARRSLARRRVIRGQKKAAQPRRTPKHPWYPCNPRLVGFRSKGINDFFKARITVQRIEERVLFNRRYVNELLLPIALLKPGESFVSLPQSQINHAAPVGPNVRAAELLRLLQGLQSLCPVAFQPMDVRHHHKSTMVSEVITLLVLRERFIQTSGELERYSQHGVSVAKARFQFYRLLEMFDRVLTRRRRG